MTGEIILLLAISIVCDVVGQIVFKLGANRLPDVGTVGLRVFLLRLTAQPWLIGGIVIYMIEFIVWVRVLALVPLGIAFPIASLNILGIVLASRIFLGEPVKRKQWIGAALVTAGVALVAQTL